MIHIEEAIIVEGKYDKELLKKVTDAPVICTHGFQLYRSKELLTSIRNMAKNRGIIILTDSDRAGFKIRNYLKTCLGENYTIKNAYIPSIIGKERRKDKPGKDGLLGVEGMDISLIEDILKRVTQTSEAKSLPKVSKTNFFEDGLTGKPDSAERRRQLTEELGLPPRISANALLDFINQLGGFPLYRNALDQIDQKNKENIHEGNSNI